MADESVAGAGVPEGRGHLPSARAFGRTNRQDAWWLKPLAVFLGLSAFIVYSTWAALQGVHYTAGPYLSPFYSPELFGASEHGACSSTLNTRGRPCSGMSVFPTSCSAVITVSSTRGAANSH